MTDDIKETKTIGFKEMMSYREGSYQLTTIVPYSRQDPLWNVRIVNQEELNNFLEDYNDFGEFIVDITRIDANIH